MRKYSQVALIAVSVRLCVLMSRLCQGKKYRLHPQLPSAAAAEFLPRGPEHKSNRRIEFRGRLSAPIRNITLPAMAVVES